MNENSPKISVIMSVFNQKAEYLRKSIESILQQTFGDFEFIIIDDGSTDRLVAEILGEYAGKDSRIKLIKNQKNNGPIGHIKGLNETISSARGIYIARMDSDDISEPNRLEKEYEFLERHPDYMLVGSWTRVMDESNKIIGRSKPYTNYRQIKKNLIRYNFFINPSCLFRKSLIEKVGGYSRNFGNSEDYDFFLRIVSRYKVANIPEFLFRYRMNMNGVSFSNNKEQEYFSLKIRLNAIKNYGHSKFNYIYLFRPLLMYLFIPFPVKKFILKMYYKFQ